MRCKQAQIACEGFERWPVFIVRTQSGYRKRRPLDEVKSPLPTLCSSIDSPSAEAMRYISWFGEKHGVSSPAYFGGLSSSHWLAYFMQCQEPVFHRSLLAVSLTAFGMQFKRPEVTTAGRKLYILSLKSVRDYMLITESVEWEELPAAVCTLVLHELLHPTMECSTSWLAHLNGLYGLIIRRGPHRHCNPESRAVLDHCRHLALIQNLASRKSSAFCLPIWLSQPWNGVVKDIQQLVIDYGLQLASLYEQCDFVSRNCVRPEDMARILDSCIKLHGSAQKLYNEQKSLDSMAKSTGQAMVNSSTPTASDIVKSTLSITLLTIQLGASISACQIVNRLSSLPVHATETLSQGTQLTIKNAGNLASGVDVLARQILATVQICPSECTGALDSAMIVYALNLASQCLAPGYQTTINCQRLIEQFRARVPRLGALLRSS